MRQYFDYGDVRDAVNSQMELQRQQVQRPLLSFFRLSNQLDIYRYQGLLFPQLFRQRYKKHADVLTTP